MRRGHARRVVLRVALATLVGLLLVELSVRVYTGSLFAPPADDERRYSIIDPVVGRVPRAGVAIRHPKGFTVTIGEHGTRSNGETVARAARPVTLAVGDSFAFGDEVDDADAWPAALERLSGGRVINAAVPGFGLDQAVLRAEQLAEIYDPDTIIVSFIPHDVIRCEMSYWSGNAKPYFDIDSAGLRLHAAPVPARSVWAPLKQLLSRSLAIELLFAKYLHWDGPDTVVHDRGREVACRLSGRLAALERSRHVRIVILAQPQALDAMSGDVEIKNGVLACAVANNLLTLDLFPVIDALPQEQRMRLFKGHMTAEGNRLVATELARFLGPAAAP